MTTQQGDTSLSAATSSAPCWSCVGYPGCFEDCAKQDAWLKKTDSQQHIIVSILSELYRAERIHQPGMTKAHYYAVIAEEFREYEAEVFREKSEKLTEPQRRELVQLAAMCIRAMKDLG